MAKTGDFFIATDTWVGEFVRRAEAPHRMVDKAPLSFITADSVEEGAQLGWDDPPRQVHGTIHRGRWIRSRGSLASYPHPFVQGGVVSLVLPNCGFEADTAPCNSDGVISVATMMRS